MKKAVKLTALSLGLALSSSFAMAVENIAFVDPAYIIQNHPDREAVAKKLEAEFKGTSEKLQANKKKIDGKIEALQQEAPKLRSADIKKREDEINKLIKDHDEQVHKFQEESGKRESEEHGKILESIQVATNNIAKERGYTYVINASSLLYAVDGKDITEDVLKSIPKTVEAPAEEQKKAK